MPPAPARGSGLDRCSRRRARNGLPSCPCQSRPLRALRCARSLRGDRGQEEDDGAGRGDRLSPEIRRRDWDGRRRGGAGAEGTQQTSARERGSCELTPRGGNGLVQRTRTPARAVRSRLRQGSGRGGGPGTRGATPRRVTVRRPRRSISAEASPGARGGVPERAKGGRARCYGARQRATGGARRDGACSKPRATPDVSVLECSARGHVGGGGEGTLAPATTLSPAGTIERAFLG